MDGMEIVKEFRGPPQGSFLDQLATRTFKGLVYSRPIRGLLANSPELDELNSFNDRHLGHNR